MARSSIGIDSDKIKHLLKSRGSSQVWLSKQIGLQHRSLYYLLNRGTASKPVVMLMAQTLGVSEMELMTYVRRKTT